jgi:hypothetical protein
LRYFESVDNPTSGQNKANALLKLYNRKTRELKVNGAFGDISVRAGTLLPVHLDLGEVLANNYMLVEKVTHNFDHDYHTMDLTLEGAWDDKEYEIKSETIGELLPENKTSSSGGGYSGGGYSSTTSGNTTTKPSLMASLKVYGNTNLTNGKYTIYYHSGISMVNKTTNQQFQTMRLSDSKFRLTITNGTSDTADRVQIVAGGKTLIWNLNRAAKVNSKEFDISGDVEIYIIWAVSPQKQSTSNPYSLLSK